MEKELLTIDTIISNVYTDEDGYSDAYGYRVYESHPLAKIVKGELLLGYEKISDYNEFKFKSKIPALYCIREIGTKSFICGLDLMQNGTVWVGVGKRDVELKTIKEALTIAEEESKCKCFICLEGEMSI